MNDAKWKCQPLRVENYYIARIPRSGTMLAICSIFHKINSVITLGVQMPQEALMFKIVDY